MRKNHYLYYIFIVFFFLALGFLRDYIFVNLNYQASVTYYKTQTEYRVAESLRFIETWSYSKLYYSKWLLTLLFAACYGLLTLGSVHLVFKTKLYNKLTIYVYAGIFAVSFIAFCIGYFTNNFAKGYSIARQLMGWLQSPIILMLLMPALLLNNSKK